MAGMGGIQPALGGGEVLPCLGIAWHPGGPEAVRKAWLAAPPCRTSGPWHVSLCLRSPEKQNDGGAEKGALPGRVDSQACGAGSEGRGQVAATRMHPWGHTPVGLALPQPCTQPLAALPTLGGPWPPTMAPTQLPQKPICL